MTRIKRLDPAVRQADEKEQAALKRVAEAQSRVNIEKNKLAQLGEYRNEYLFRQDYSRISLSAIELQEFNRFLAQLDDTISRQQAIIEQCERELDNRRSSWQKTQINCKVMHQVVENLQKEEVLQQMRNEQKVMDEFSLRKRIIR